MITIVDYGLGNISAFYNVYKRLNIAVSVASNSAELRNSHKIILPGVGAFDWAMERLCGSGLKDTLDELVLHHKRPILGVCVGMHLMASESEEGDLPGLGWIKGKVKKITSDTNLTGVMLPHMGWNSVACKPSSGLYNFVGGDANFYFLHSYMFCPDSCNNISATTDYHTKITASIEQDNIFGTQFHPEKSHGNGETLLKNFSEIQ